MKKNSIKKYFVAGLIIILSIAFTYWYFGRQKLGEPTPKVKNVQIVAHDHLKKDLYKINEKATEALEFCKTKNFNTDFCILIDMSVHSGRKRFFIYDFKKAKISHQYLVGHGCGNHIWSLDQTKNNPTFSNENNSHLSSLGKYKIGERGYSNWGVNVKYLMHGLDKTNSNALKRIIVFHSWEVMTDEEIYPFGSAEGWGCPTISNNAFKAIDPLLKDSKKPVLMWIYD